MSSPTTSSAPATSTPAESKAPARKEATNVPPSKVVHFRGISPLIHQADLINLVSPFGVATNVLLIRKTQQALLEFAEKDSAVNFIRYYSNVQCNVRGQNIYPGFSSHAAIQAEPTTQNQTPNCILLATILNPLFPITVDVLVQVFSPYGPLEKMIIFNNKNAALQALVKFTNLRDAVEAKKMLQNQFIFANCCQLSIVFSNLEDITVTANTDKSRDFKSQGLVSSPAPLYRGNANGGARAAATAATFTPTFASGSTVSPVVLVTGIPASMDCTKLFNLFSVYGAVQRIKVMYNKRDHALVQYADPQQATNAIRCLKGVAVCGARLDVAQSKHASIQTTSPADASVANMTQDFGPSVQRYRNVATASKYLSASAPTAVLHVSNIPASATAESLAALFAPFGTVVATRLFVRNEKPMFLAQMGDVATAATALVSLHNTKVENNTIRVAFSSSSVQQQQ